MNLDGKSFLVAGGTGGLGREVVLALAEHNCSLMIIHSEKDQKYQALKAKLQGMKARVQYYQCDFTKADEINDAIDVFFEQEKEPYALVNLIGDPVRVDWKQAQIAQMQDSFLRNASAPLHSAKVFGLKLKASRH